MTSVEPGAAFGLDGVAVVDDLEGLRLPLEPQRIERRLDGAGEVDRRLLGADAAGLVAAVEVAPLLGSAMAFVFPMRTVGGLRQTGAQRTSQQAEGKAPSAQQHRILQKPRLLHEGPWGRAISRAIFKHLQKEAAQDPDGA